MKTKDAIVLACFSFGFVWLGLWGLALFIFHNLTAAVFALLISGIYQVLGWYTNWRLD